VGRPATLAGTPRRIAGRCRPAAAAAAGPHSRRAGGRFDLVAKRQQGSAMVDVEHRLLAQGLGEIPIALNCVVVRGFRFH
jgi:hypothetical protein